MTRPFVDRLSKPPEMPALLTLNAVYTIFRLLVLATLHFTSPNNGKRYMRCFGSPILGCQKKIESNPLIDDSSHSRHKTMSSMNDTDVLQHAIDTLRSFTNC